MIKTVGIVIPCYKANGKINDVINGIHNAKDLLGAEYNIKIYLIDDSCPYQSSKEIIDDSGVVIITHQKNLGVGAATQTGFRAAIDDKCEVIIKIDADNQHSTGYLIELIPYAASIEPNRLLLIKGTRYNLLNLDIKAPIFRRVGSLALEPIARAALNYRGLTDIANGYLATNLITTKYILSKEIRPKLESRYLFESSLLQKCSLLDCEIHQFPMLAKYSTDWRSSLQARNIILPLCIFFMKSVFQRLAIKYLFRINLGTALLLICLICLSFASSVFITIIQPSIASGVLVSAGISASFTSLVTLTLLALAMFFFYDYSAGIKVKNIYFKYLTDELKSP